MVGWSGHATIGIVAAFVVASVVIMRDVRRVPHAPTNARDPLTDMAPRSMAFSGGPAAFRTVTTGTDAAVDWGATRAAASSPALVAPTLMPDFVHPPQGTLPLAMPDPPAPPSPLVPPAMSVDPWAQRRLRQP